MDREFDIDNPGDKQTKDPVPNFFSAKIQKKTIICASSRESSCPLVFNYLCVHFILIS